MVCIHEPVTAVRIQVILLVSRIVSTLKSSYQKPGDSQLEQKAKKNGGLSFKIVLQISDS